MNNFLELSTNEIINVFGGYVGPRMGCTYMGTDSYFSTSSGHSSSWTLYKCTKEPNKTVIYADMFFDGKYTGGFETETWPPGRLPPIVISGTAFCTTLLFYSLYRILK